MEKDTVIPDWLDRGLYPFENRFITIDGNLVHYVDEGQGPVLLMLHGNPSWSFLYRHIIKGLKQNFRCIALDYPGFGLSKARKGYSFTPEEHSYVVEKFCTALELNEIRMMVQDWGGPIGLGFAGRQPEMIHSLFIGNTWAWPAQNSKTIANFSKIAGSGLATFLIQAFNAFAAWLLPQAISRKLSKAEKTAYTRPFPTWSSRWPVAKFPKEILKSRDFLQQVEVNLKRLSNKNVLILWGDKDTGFREPERKRFEEIFPQHHTVVLHGAKHMIQEEAPEEICQAILSFEQT